MSTQRDFYFEVSIGNIPGHRAIHKFGHNPDANSAGVFWPIMEAAAAVPYQVYTVSGETETEVVGHDFEQRLAEFEAAFNEQE